MEVAAGQPDCAESGGNWKYFDWVNKSASYCRFNNSLGGEPLEPENRKDISNLLKKVKQHCQNKTIWLYSSYLYEEIEKFDEEILSYIDILVDGPFVDELKDRKLRFRGSSNQRVIDVQLTLKKQEIVLYSGSRYYKKN